MKQQSLLRLLIVAVIVSATFLVMAAARSSQAKMCKEDCTADKSYEQNTQSEFFLESLTRSLLSK